MIYNIQQLGVDAYIEQVREMLSERQLRYYVITFGCQQNEADSEKIRGLCDRMGYTAAETADDADIVIVNTCAIREHAEMKALSMLGRYKEKKKN